MALLKIKTEKKLSPSIIKGMLFYFANVAKHFHLETDSFAVHKALGETYDSISSFQDSICEALMGYLDGDRIGVIKIDDMPEYSLKNSKQLAEDLIDFSYQLYEWSGEKKYCDIENMAQSLSGVGAKLKYLLTLN